MRIKILLLSAALMASIAHADPVRVRVTDAAGAPVQDAVVMLDGGATQRGSGKVSWPLAMAQKDLAFDPYILVVPAGSEVSFPNLDRVRHHVYSFSKGNRFELKLFGRDESRSVTLVNPGIVAVGCNIHDSMVGYIRVVDTPYAGKTNSSGEITFDTSGPVTSATVWHPDAAPAEVRVSLTGTSAEAAVAVLSFKTPSHHGH